ncbi:MAG: DNA-processing protein DprA [Clostridia bacterium]|nr:DNA-processing protein DprA [Clostridia bacterium]
MKYDEKELLIIWLDSFKEIEYKHKRALYEMLIGKSELKRNIEHNAKFVKDALGDAGYNLLINSANREYLKDTVSRLNAAGETAITLASDNYPEKLKETPEPPLSLYARGNTELLNGEIFGMVGSRKSLPLSLSVAKDFAAELINGGFILATGTAEGVDAEVIKAALSSGKIIAVSAGGLDNLYPAANAGLIEEVAKRGLVISEHREDVKPLPYFFPVRNRIIAGLSTGVLIVSGRLKSGTMHTAEYCVDYGRDLFAVPYSVGIESGAGTNALIKRGAYLADSPEDILSFYGIEKEEKEETIFSDTEREIVAALKDGALHIEKIAERTGKNIFETTSAITMLEIKGVVSKNGINTYGLIRNMEI